MFMQKKKDDVIIPYVHQEFPKWKFKKHTDKPFISKLVHSEEQEKELGSEWHEKPEWHETAPALKALVDDEETFEFPVPEVKKRGRPAKAKE